MLQDASLFDLLFNFERGQLVVFFSSKSPLKSLKPKIRLKIMIQKILYLHGWENNNQDTITESTILFFVFYFLLDQTNDALKKDSF